MLYGRRTEGVLKMKKFRNLMTAVLLLSLILAGCSNSLPEPDPSDATTTEGEVVTDPEKIESIRQFIDLFYYNPAFGLNSIDSISEARMKTFVMYYLAEMRPDRCTVENNSICVDETAMAETVQEFFDVAIEKHRKTEEIDYEDNQYKMVNRNFKDMSFLDLDYILAQGNDLYEVYGLIGYADDFEQGMIYVGELKAEISAKEDHWILKGYKVTTYEVPKERDQLKKGSIVHLEAEEEQKILAFMDQFYQNKAFGKKGSGAILAYQMREWALYHILAGEEGYREENNSLYIAKEEVERKVKEYFGVDLEEHGNTGIAVYLGDQYRISKDLVKTTPEPSKLTLKEIYETQDGKYEVYYFIMDRDKVSGLLKAVIEKKEGRYILLEYTPQASDLASGGIGIEGNMEAELELFINEIYASPIFHDNTVSPVSLETAEESALDLLQRNPTENCESLYGEGYCLIPLKEVKKTVDHYFGLAMELPKIQKAGIVYDTDEDAYEVEFTGGAAILNIIELKSLEQTGPSAYQAVGDLIRPGEKASDKDVLLGTLEAKVEYKEDHWVLKDYKIAMDEKGESME